MLRWSHRADPSATASGCLGTGKDSAVSAASSTYRLPMLSRRRSAGTLSPDCRTMTSPGTSSSAGRVGRCPSPSTTALGDNGSRRASRARSPRPSWTPPMAALITTTPGMTPVSTPWVSGGHARGRHQELDQDVVERGQEAAKGATATGRGGAIGAVARLSLPGDVAGEASFVHLQVAKHPWDGQGVPRHSLGIGLLIPRQGAPLLAFSRAPSAGRAG